MGVFERIEGMLPAASPIGTAVKPAQPATAQTAIRTTQPQAPETARTSAGETAAANVRTETPNAIQAAEQSSVAPRIRDQETIETTDRADPPKDDPTGPDPAFKESPLERQARVVFDPPDLTEAPTRPATQADTRETDTREADPSLEAAEVTIDAPPTPTEKAEAGFTETVAMAESKEPSTLDMAR